MHLWFADVAVHIHEEAVGGVVAINDWTAFQKGQVDTEGCQWRQNVVKATGYIWHRQHQADAVSVWMNAWCFSEADVANVVPRIGHFLTQNMQLIRYFQVGWHNPCDEIVARVCNFFADVFGTFFNNVAVEGGQKFGAVVVRAAIDNNGFQAGEWHIVGRNQFIMKVDFDAAHNVAGFFEEQVVGERLCTGAVVFDWQNAILCKPEIDGIDDLHVVIQSNAAWVIEQSLCHRQIVRIVGDGNAAAGWEGVVGESSNNAVDEAFIRINELRLTEAADAEQGFIGFTQRHNEVSALVFSDMIENPEFTVTIEDWQVVFLFIFCDILGQIKTLNNKVQQFIINSVDFNADFI